MVDEMTQTDFARSRTNSVAKVEVRGRSPVREYELPTANVKNPSPIRDAEPALKPLRKIAKELLPQPNMLSPLVFEMPQRVAKSPEQFFIGFDQKPPQKQPLKFAPRTSTPKTKIPIRKKNLSLERPKTAPTNLQQSKPNTSPKKRPASPLKTKPKTPLPIKRQNTPLQPKKETFNIVQTPPHNRPSPARSSPFPESAPPPADGIYAIAVNFLNGPTIKCLEYDGNVMMNKY
jgi:hypothetical protein